MSTLRVLFTSFVVKRNDALLPTCGGALVVLFVASMEAISCVAMILVAGWTVVLQDSNVASHFESQCMGVV